MKVDRRDPRHWWRLALFTAAALLSIAARPLRRARRRKRVLFYGHRLAGNLLPIYRALGERPDAAIDVAFLTMDPAYRDELTGRGFRAILAGSSAAVDWMSTASAVVSDHGLHAMALLLPLRGIRFVDVWHGIPFKGFDVGDFRLQHRFDEVWVASPMLARMYVERFGFDERRVFATGYARTDQLVTPMQDRAAARRDFSLPETGQVVLFAPTWRQDDAGRNLYPFGQTEERFLALLSDTARRHDATVVVRHHLNSKHAVTQAPTGVVFLPFSAFPDTERLLLATDVLICDWSSIAFDFLLLERPTIFLDVPPPFAKGLAIDSTARYGAIVGSTSEIEKALQQSLSNSAQFVARCQPAMATWRARLYGRLADGKACERCVGRLRALVQLAG